MESRVMESRKRALCPVCGEKAHQAGMAKDGRLVLSCGDAVPWPQWDKKSWDTEGPGLLAGFAWRLKQNYADDRRKLASVYQTDIGLWATNGEIMGILQGRHFEDGAWGVWKPRAKAYLHSWGLPPVGAFRAGEWHQKPYRRMTVEGIGDVANAAQVIPPYQGQLRPFDWRSAIVRAEEERGNKRSYYDPHFPPSVIVNVPVGGTDGTFPVRLSTDYYALSRRFVGDEVMAWGTNAESPVVFKHQSRVVVLMPLRMY